MEELELLRQLLEEQRRTNQYLEHFKENGVGYYTLPAPLWDVEGLAKHLDVPLSSVYDKLTPTNTIIPHIQFGKHKRFCPTKTQQFLESLTVKTKEEIRAEILANPKRIGKRNAESPKDAAPCRPKVSASKSKDQIRAKDYGEHLDKYDWDFFTVFTTNYPLKKKNARTLIERFCKLISKEHSVSCFWLAEKNGAGDYHIHAVLKFHTETDKDRLRLETRKCWQRIAGKKAKKNSTITELENSNKKVTGGSVSENDWHRVSVETFVKEKHGCFYISHKLKKQEEIEYDYFGFEHFSVNEVKD